MDWNDVVGSVLHNVRSHLEVEFQRQATRRVQELTACSQTIVPRTMNFSFSFQSLLFKIEFKLDSSV